MKTLILMRHAKSSWKEPFSSDFDRTLTKRGKTDAPEMGKRLHRRQIVPDLMMTSPAKRAVETAKIVAGELGYPVKKIEKNENIYEAKLEDLIHLVHSLDDSADTILLIGHNPGFYHLVNHLSEDYLQEFPTSAVCAIEFRTDSWRKINQNSGRTLYYDYPKKPH